MDFKSCQCLRTTGLCTLGTTVKGFWPPEYLDLLSDLFSQAARRSSTPRVILSVWSHVTRHRCHKTVCKACSYLLASRGGCVGWWGACNVQRTWTAARRWWPSYPKIGTKSGMNIPATSRLGCQRLGVSNADFSIRWYTVFKIMNVFFVISSVLQCYSNHHQWRFYLQLDTVVCKSSSLLGLRALSPSPLFFVPIQTSQSRKEKVLGTEESLIFLYFTSV